MHANAVGMTPARLLSSFSLMTTNGSGRQRRTMATRVRLRPRRASSVTSMSRRARRSNCSSMGIPGLQVFDCLHGLVQYQCHFGAVGEAASLGDASIEVGEQCLQRRLRLEPRLGTSLDAPEG